MSGSDRIPPAGPTAPPGDGEGECIFGTDGVRDRAGEGFLEPERVRRLMESTAAVLGRRERFPRDFPPDRVPPAARRVIIGRDTRASGEDLSRQVASALARAGFPVLDAGVIPTPGIAYLAARDPDAILGVMISASHNPAEYNGIKFLAPTGAKISREFEEEVSRAFLRGERPGGSPAAAAVEPARRLLDGYIEFLIGRSRHPERLRGRTVALDAANGAAVEAAERVFGALGARVIGIGDRPDGRNINSGCGALHPQELARRTAAEGAFLGFAFDGDADRMIPVTESGTILDGDHVLAIAGASMRRAGRLPRRIVVTTVMANLGLEKALAVEGVGLERTPVGDRFVHEAMAAAGHPLGGEQSGHIIFLEDAQTGDGILAALRLIDCLPGEAKPSLESASRMLRKYPQTLKGYRVPRKVPLETLPEVQAAIERAHRHLAGDGRIVVRYSGTEPLARVMIEGPEQALIEKLAEEIGRSILDSIAG